MEIKSFVPSKRVGIFSDREWNLLYALGIGMKNEPISKILQIQKQSMETAISRLKTKCRQEGLYQEHLDFRVWCCRYLTQLWYSERAS